MEPENINDQNEKTSMGVATMYIGGFNLFILLLYTIYFKGSHSGSDAILGLAFTIPAQAVLNFITGIILLFFRKLENFGKACMLSSLIVLLIGLSTCFMVTS